MKKIITPLLFVFLVGSFQIGLLNQLLDGNNLVKIQTGLFNHPSNNNHLIDVIFNHFPFTWMTALGDIIWTPFLKLLVINPALALLDISLFFFLIMFVAARYASR